MILTNVVLLQTQKCSKK